MPRRRIWHALASAPVAAVATLAVSLAMLNGCTGKAAKPDAAEAPPNVPTVIDAGTDNAIHVAQASLFPLITAQATNVFNTVSATGSVQPDISREVPVLSIANGRVLALHVALGNAVHKGQLVMDVQSPDVTQAFMSYQTALSNENLANTVLTRDKLLFDKGAIAHSQLEIAQNGEDTSKAALLATEQQLRILGVDKDHPGDTVHVYAPISGVVVAQNTTAAGAAGINLAGISGSLTIADLTHVWVICDVYENDLANVHLGEQATINLNAFPGKPTSGTISDIGAILDPSIRTAKVRIQVQNPGSQLRIGMFATTTFRGKVAQPAVALPGDAILHLHDRDYVYVPTGGAGDFKRIIVKSGQSLPGGLVAIESGVGAGQQVVSNALQLQNAAGQ